MLMSTTGSVVTPLTQVKEIKYLYQRLVPTLRLQTSDTRRKNNESRSSKNLRLKEKPNLQQSVSLQRRCFKN